MIYPNGSITEDRLKKMIGNPEYVVYAEDTNVPEDWNSNEIYRGPRTQIHTYIEALKYMMEDHYTICYDLTEEYYKKHPYVGEAKMYTKELFNWQFHGKHPYAIHEYNARHKNENYTSLELVRYKEDFEGTCWTIAEWERDSEGYEFRSIGSRLFTDIDANDLSTVWEAITAGDKYLRKKFKEIEQYTNGGV